MAYGLDDLNRACVSGNVDAARQILADHPDFADIVGDLRIVEMLINRGAVVDRSSDVGATPFFCAAYTSNLSVAHYLLDKGADINARMPPDQSSKGSALEETGKRGTPEMKAMCRKYLAMRVRRCVLGPVSEHPRRQMARDPAPGIASFLV